MDALVLYYRKACPFCRKVLDYLETKNREVPLREIGEDSKAFDQLSSLAGKTQVPCLVINGEALFESLDIIDWFENNQ